MNDNKSNDMKLKLLKMLSEKNNIYFEKKNKSHTGPPIEMSQF